MREELNTTIDDFSQDVMLSHLEVLLNYSNRFTNVNHYAQSVLTLISRRAGTTAQRLLRQRCVAGKRLCPPWSTWPKKAQPFAPLPE